MSSTAREVLGIYHVLRSATQLVLGQVAGASIRISVDNQGAASAVNNFRSKAPDVHSAIKKIFFLGAEFSFDVVADWKPRELMALEDALSKAPDSSDWASASSGMTRSVTFLESDLLWTSSRLQHGTNCPAS